MQMRSQMTPVWPEFELLFSMLLQIGLQSPGHFYLLLGLEWWNLVKTCILVNSIDWQEM